MSVAETKDRVSRSSLVALVDGYLDALRERDPGRLDLCESARFTENGQVLPLGEGLWTTVSSVADEPFVVITDETAGSVLAFTWVDEISKPTALVTRITVNGGRIAEIETIVSRGTYFAGIGAEVPEHALTRRSVFDAELDTVDRRSRWELADATNLYLDAIERGDGSIIPVTDECRRLENGVVTARNPTGEGMPDTVPHEGLAMGVAEQITKSTVSQIVQRARHRRFVAIDQSRGAVGIFFFFDHCQYGMVTHPNSLFAAEAFKHVGGKIVHIEAAWEIVPYGAPSGWDA